MHSYAAAHGACPVVLIPNWERVVVGNLSDKLGPNWELGPNCAAAANSVGIGWESGSPKNSVGAPKIAWEPKNGMGFL